ncbi:unnamed protein product, partial [Staurois parvus]
LTSCRPPAVYKRQGGGSPGVGCPRTTAIRCPLCPPGHSETLIVGRDLCTRSRSCDH